MAKTRTLYALELERARFALGEAMSMYVAVCQLTGTKPVEEAIDRWRYVLGMPPLGTELEDIGSE